MRVCGVRGVWRPCVRVCVCVGCAVCVRVWGAAHGASVACAVALSSCVAASVARPCMYARQMSVPGQMSLPPRNVRVTMDSGTSRVPAGLRVATRMSGAVRSPLERRTCTCIHVHT